MGSNLQSSKMPESKRNAFLKAFSKLKQQVLWKWEADTLPGQPRNVRIGEWLPQSDILGRFWYRNKPSGKEGYVQLIHVSCGCEIYINRIMINFLLFFIYYISLRSLDSFYSGD
jgi:hypothetical protein